MPTDLCVGHGGGSTERGSLLRGEVLHPQLALGMKINRILFLFPKWVVLKFDSRPCINSYGGIWSRLLACLVLFRNHTWDCHIGSGYTANQPCLQGRHFELQCLYSESINEVYCSDGKILVTVLGTIKKLLPLIFSVD